MIAPNVIIIWPGTHAGIPAGFTRETTLDDRFVKGVGVEAVNVTGGAQTHSHTSTTHGHTLNSHTHDVDLTDNSSPANASSQGGSTMDNHRHVAAAIGGVSGGSLNNTAVTWSSVNHEPPYYKVIYIKSSGYKFMPANAIGLLNSATVPTGFLTCDGGGGTPDLRGKYFKGASTGADAGAGSGAVNHSHDISHTHTVNSHTHSGTSGYPNTSSLYRRTGSPLSGTYYPHTHSVSLDATTDAISSYANTTAGSGDTVEPPYYMILAIKNTSGVAKMPPVGLIGLWLGSAATVPAGWFICNGAHGTPNLTDKFVKVVNTSGDLGSTAGSQTHAHANVSHTHSATGTHTHTGPSSSGPTNTSSQEPGGEGYAISTHTHPILSVSSTTATYANTDIDCQTVNHEPPYRTVYYIQYQFGTGGAALFAIL